MDHIKETIKKLGSPQEIISKIEANTPAENTDTSLQNNGCEYCGGAGFVHPVVGGKPQYDRTIPCRCRAGEVERYRKESILKSCEFPPLVAEMSFDNFKVYPAVKTAFAIAKKIANEPGKLAWAAFLGFNGVGKTHLAVAICKAWVDAGIPSRYVFVPLLLDELKEGFGKSDDSSYHNRFNYYSTIPLLLLDDLGVESKTPWVQEKLETLIDYRLMHKLSLIVTCNKSLDELSPRIASRLARLPESYIVNIDADDYMVNKHKGEARR